MAAGGRGAAGHGLHRMRGAPAHGNRRVDQHRQHHRRGAEKTHAVTLDGVEDGGGLHPPQAHAGAGQRRHGPGKAPSIAMEHGQRPQIHRMWRHAARQHIAHRIEIRAAMVIQHALGVAGGARGVVEADVLPFIGGRFPVRIGGLGGQPSFVLGIAQRAVIPGELPIFDAHRARRRVEQGQHVTHLLAVLAVEQQHRRAAVRQDESQRGRIQPRVERIEHRARHRHAEVRLVQRRRIRRQHRHHVAAFDAPGPQRRRHAPAAIPGGAPTLAERGAMHERRARREHTGGPVQETQRRQRHVVGRVARQLVGVGDHCGSSWLAALRRDSRHAACQPSSASGPTRAPISSASSAAALPARARAYTPCRIAAMRKKL